MIAKLNNNEPQTNLEEISKCLADIELSLLDLNDNNSPQIRDMIKDSIVGKDQTHFEKILTIIVKVSSNFYKQIDKYSLFTIGLIRSYKKETIVDRSGYILRRSPIFKCLIYDDTINRNVLRKTALKNHLIEDSALNNFYFTPEIVDDEQLIRQSYLGEFCDNFFNDIKKGYYNGKMNTGENKNKIALIIKKDSWAKLKTLIEENSISLDSPIEFSLYEQGSLICDPILRPTPILYAAFYGSIQIFNNLISIYEKTNQPLQLYTFYTNDTEVIKRAFTTGYEFHDYDLNESIKYIVDVLFDSPFADKIKSIEDQQQVPENNLAIMCLMKRLLLLVHMEDPDKEGDDYAKSFMKQAIAPFESIPNRSFQTNGPYFNLQDGMKPIHVAAIQGDVWKLAELKKYQAFDPNALDDHQMTPLVYSIINNNFYFMKELLKIKNVDPNIECAEGTAIFYALETKGPYTEYLLENEDINLVVTNKSGLFPFQHAMKVNSDDFYRLFSENFEENHAAFLSLKKPELHLIIETLDGDVKFLERFLVNKISVIDFNERDANNV